jgi:hypothetical protein
MKERLWILVGRKPNERFRVMFGERDVSEFFDVARMEFVLDANDMPESLRVRLDVFADVVLEDVEGIDLVVVDRKGEGS